MISAPAMATVASVSLLSEAEFGCGMAAIGTSFANVSSEANVNRRTPSIATQERWLHQRPVQDLLY